MFQRIRAEIQCLEGEDQNSNVCKDMVRISMLERIRSKFACLERYGKNSSDWKD